MKQRLTLALWAVMVPATIASIHMQNAVVFMISILICATYVAWPSIVKFRFRKGDTVVYIPQPGVPTSAVYAATKDNLQRAERYKVISVHKETGLIKIDGGQMWHHPKQFFLYN